MKKDFDEILAFYKHICAKFNEKRNVFYATLANSVVQEEKLML